MSKSSSIVIFLVIVIVLIGGITLVANKTQAPTGENMFPGGTSAGSESINPSANETSTTSSTTMGSYTLDQVAMHKTQTDCWTAINGKVYNLTPFVTKHPGGVDNIIKVCGIDGTTLFANQHDSQKNPNTALSMMQIGVLVK
jgi:cytochrome b involved in lipid metabolism